MSMDQLMTFRTIILRSIAEAWLHDTGKDNFRARLLQNPREAMDSRFGFPWPWPACDLQFNDAAKTSAWIEGGWQWSPMTGIEDLKLYLPLDPDRLEIPSKDRGRALADYYRARPSLFSDDWGNHDNPNPQSTGGDSGPPAGGYIPAGRNFADFKVVLLEAMAWAWADPTFRRKLELNAATALRSIRDYCAPWDLVIVIEDDAKARWSHPCEDIHPGSGTEIRQSYWKQLTNDMLTLNLPAKPRELQSEPVALAAYNAIGARYPFTCCMGDDR